MVSRAWLLPLMSAWVPSSVCSQCWFPICYVAFFASIKPPGPGPIGHTPHLPTPSLQRGAVQMWVLLHSCPETQPLDHEVAECSALLIFQGPCQQFSLSLWMPPPPLLTTLSRSQFFTSPPVMASKAGSFIRRKQCRVSGPVQGHLGKTRWFSAAVGFPSIQSHFMFSLYTDLFGLRSWTRTAYWHSGQSRSYKASEALAVREHMCRDRESHRRKTGINENDVKWGSRTASQSTWCGERDTVEGPSWGGKRGEQGRNHMQNRLRRPGPLAHLDLWSGWISKVRHREAKWASPSCGAQWPARARTQGSDFPQPFSVTRLSLPCWGSADGERLLSWNPRAAGRQAGRWFTFFMVPAFYVSLSSLPQMNLWDCAL